MKTQKNKKGQSSFTVAVARALARRCVSMGVFHEL